MGTSRLQHQTVKAMDRIFGCYAVQENVRPEWLTGSQGRRLELDVFIPSLNIAIEVQGPQHYRYSEHLHGSVEAFELRQKHDSYKRVVCKQRGIVLHEVASESDLHELINKLRGRVPPVDSKYLDFVRNARERQRDEYISYRLYPYTKKLRAAKEQLKAAIINLPEGEQHSRETDRASALIIRRTNQLDRAKERETENYGKFGRRGYRHA